MKKLVFQSLMGRDGPQLLAKLARRHFLLLLMAAYALAYFFPGPGMRLRSISVAVGNVEVSPVFLMLSALTFNCGVALECSKLKKGFWRLDRTLVGVGARWGAAFVGLAAASLMAAAFPEQSGQAGVLLGLCLAASMPAANASAAWTQNADGDVALCLAIIIVTTLVSPLVSPLFLGFAGGWFVPGYSTIEAGVGLARSVGTASYWVVGPLMLGALTSRILRRSNPNGLVEGAKVVNWVILLTLNYVNASASLPWLADMAPGQSVVLALSATAACCVATFAGAYVVARITMREPGQVAAVVFPAGMSNGGYALTVATTALPHEPMAQVVVLGCILAQHLLAGAADHWLIQPADQCLRETRDLGGSATSR